MSPLRILTQVHTLKTIIFSAVVTGTVGTLDMKPIAGQTVWLCIISTLMPHTFALPQCIQQRLYQFLPKTLDSILSSKICGVCSFCFFYQSDPWPIWSFHRCNLGRRIRLLWCGKRLYSSTLRWCGEQRSLRLSLKTFLLCYNYLFPCHCRLQPIHQTTFS